MTPRIRQYLCVYKQINKPRMCMLGLIVTTLAGFYFCLPDPLFKSPMATVILDSKHRLLGARIATDGQWRFPVCKQVPPKFEKAILYFEDQYFYYHPGINPIAIGKAIFKNLRARRIVCGGSTLSVQVIRIARQGKPRTLLEKCKEAVLALRLECRYTKKEILSLYASYAPFGSNVVGIEAASWRYYERPPDHLSWGEVCALAVLPNAPSLIYPGKNEALLLRKRNVLLEKLYNKGVIDATTCVLAKAEPLPCQPNKLPQLAPHLLQEVIKAGHEGERITTTLDKDLQAKTQTLLEKHCEIHAANQIHNGALVVVEVETGHVLAYHGNVHPATHHGVSAHVNIITAPRSSGSTLKPLLYASMLNTGELLPHTLLPDIPVCIAGYKPQNYSKRYDGAVSASQVLVRSLNVPAVRMLQDYGLGRFYESLKKLGFSTITKAPNHYGLSLILGGAEITLETLVAVYASMARALIHFHKYNALYDPRDYHGLHWQQQVVPHTLSKRSLKVQAPFFGAAAIWWTFEALSAINRPTEESAWQIFHSAQKIAWKTGTSYGHKDAWAVGVTPGYVVGVWIGNADGEGRPGMTGTQTAAPVMLDVFRLLPPTGWFAPPYDDLIEIPVCAQSGYRAAATCEPIKLMEIPRAGLKTRTCPYHRYIHLDRSARFRVTSDTYNVSEMCTQSWFVLPPVMEHYYKATDPFYKLLPPFLHTCIPQKNHNMDIVYPAQHAQIYIPKDFNNNRQKTVFEATHRVPDESIHWHLNETYLGSTSNIHQIEVDTEAGNHTLTLVDGKGESLVRRFTILER